jgi:hypothetical protein
MLIHVITIILVTYKSKSPTSGIPPVRGGLLEARAPKCRAELASTDGRPGTGVGTAAG